MVDYGLDERLELIKKASRLATTIRQASADLAEVIQELKDNKPRTEKELDADGNPTWSFKVKVAIPKDIWLTPAFSRYAIEKGYTIPQQIDRLFHGEGSYEGFVRYYQRTNTKWSHWTLVWQKWVRTDNDRKTQTNGKTRFDQQRTRT